MRHDGHDPGPACRANAAAVEALAYYVERRDASHDCANDDPRWRKLCKVAAARDALSLVRNEAWEASDLGVTFVSGNRGNEA